MLKSIWGYAKTPFRNIDVTPIRLNVLLIAAGILTIGLGILVLIPRILEMKIDDGPLIIGTLLGLLGSCITGLSGLGTTLMNDSSTKNKRDGDD